MNVLLVIEGTYPWYRGGVSEWVYQYIKNSKNFNFSILQIATDTFMHLNPEEALYPLPENIRDFKRVPPPELKEDWTTSLNDWYQSSNVLSASYLSKYDIIHVTNTGFAGWLGVKISDKTDIPLILTEHAVYWLEVSKGAVALECGYKIPEGSVPRQEVIALFKKIATSVYKSANQVFTVSECNITLQKELGAKNIQYIPNGIPGEWVQTVSTSGKRPVFGWVGRCAEMKNPLQFFEFIDEFKRKGLEADFLMLLSDAGENELEKKVRDKSVNYDYLTTVWNRSSKKYYSKMDMLLITSHNESQPLVMFEALSKKVLPVGREVGDLTNKYGLTYPKSFSISEICADVIQFWGKTEQFLKYVDDRFNIVKEKHTWDNIFSKYEEVILQTVRERENSQ